MAPLRTSLRLLRLPGRRSLVATAVIAAVFSANFAVRGGETPAAGDSDAFSRLYFALQPPSDREAQRRFELAKELLESGRFGEAAPLVAAQLAVEADSLDVDGGSLKQHLLQSVLGAGAKSRAVFRSVLEGQHRRALEEAVDATDLRRVVATYPPELFGVAELERLARAESDAGAYRNAALALSAARQIAEQAGDPVAERLAAEEQVQRLRLGQSVSAPSTDPTQQEWPAQREWIEATQAVASSAASRTAPNAWLSAGGDASRQVVAPGGLPVPWRLWSATVDTSDAEVDATDGAASLSAHEAIATGGEILTSTSDRLIALSAESGRRLWEVPFPVNPTSWRGDSVASGLSTDTRAAFVVTPSSGARGEESSARRQFGDSLFGGEDPVLPANCLAAYELATAGKLRWRIDGGDPKGPAPGARFLGPPAIADGRVYALAEAEQTISLLEIDATSGDVLWRQPLAQCQRAASPLIATAVVSPTIGERLIYCPTGRGAVVAVDPLRRRLEWLGYLAIDEKDARPAMQGGWGAVRDSRRWADDATAWRHCRVVEVGDRLLVASPALPSLQCFDAATGEFLWRRDFSDALLLAGITEQAALVVEADAVSAWRLRDGESVATLPLPGGDSPAGEGLMVDGHLLLPLRSGRLAMLDTSRLEAEEAWRLADMGLNPLVDAPKLGNLLYHAGLIVSRSATTVESYPQAAILRAVEKQAIDALQTNDPAAALPALQAAYDADRTDRRLAELLAVTLLRSDGVAPAALGQLPHLVAGQRATAYEAAMRLAASPGIDAATALDDARSLAASDAGDVVLRIEDHLQVTASRIAARRAELAGADPRQIEAIAARFRPTGDVAPAAEPLATTAWTERQVTAQVESFPKSTSMRRRSNRVRQDRAFKSRPIALVGDAVEGVHWSYESRGGDWLLVGASGWGERLLADELPGDPWSPSPDAAGAVGVPGDRVYGEWLALKLDTGFVVCHARSGVVWETTDTSNAAWPGVVLDPAETPAAAGPWGVVSVSGATLQCRELSTGRMVWRRELVELGSDSLRVLENDGVLYVVGSTTSGLRLAAWSGQRLGEWAAPPARNWRLAAGGNLLTEERSAGRRQFRVVTITDAATDQPAWEHDFDLTTRFLPNGDVAAFVTDKRRLTVVDVAAAAVRFATSLPGNLEAPVRSVRLRNHGARLLVEIDGSNPMVDRLRGASPIGGDPLLTGDLYCLDGQTGAALWPAPVQVDGMAIVETAVSDAPLLLLARRRAPDANEEQAEAEIALAAIDLATGATVYRNHHLPAGDENDGPAPLWAVYERTDSEQMLIRAGRSWVTLETTPQPAPPRPLMRAQVEDPEASRPKGPDEIGQGVERLFKSFWDGDDD
ncbi:Outer membrane protein assembly factor BamB [Botrimarina colliarenosi]|uniref:Outer membrane protein assembly factor BamB n=1 Tax=Botrimarina colliarenosi TaxID=2528001 RepID=A0A5C6A827_9BACT|nr:PQQ-binding-like beta-propeller repeat protein [Botrimarina colliarenosi]TWT96104.1 Outer membrane protein assembly factor BamB [Botrimarina colliarenosi]